MSEDCCTANKGDSYFTHTTFFYGKLKLRAAIYSSAQHYTSHTQAHCMAYNVFVFIVFRGQRTQPKALDFLFVKRIRIK